LNCTGIELGSTAPVDRELLRVRLAHSDSTLDCQTALFRWCRHVSVTASNNKPSVVPGQGRRLLSSPLPDRFSDTHTLTEVPRPPHPKPTR